MGILSKTIKRTFIRGEAGIPRVPAVPSSSGRWVTQQSIVCTFDPAGDLEIPGIVVPMLPPVQNCETVEERIYIPGSPGTPAIPGTPGTPSQLILDFQLGWNSRATGQYAMDRAGRFTFTITGSSVGAVVGATVMPQSSGFADIRYAFSVARGDLKVMESGMAVLSLGPNPNAVLAIERTNGQIRYYVDDVVVRTVTATADPLILAAAMYSGGDAVIDAQLDEYTTETTGHISMLPPSAVGGIAYCQGSAVSAPMLVEGMARGHASGAIASHRMEAIGGHRYSIGGVVSAPMEAEGSGYGTLPYAIADTYMNPLESWGTCLTGTVGSGAASLAPMLSLGSDRPYCFGVTSMLPPFGIGAAFYAPGEAVLFSRNNISAAVTPINIVHIVMRADMSIAGVIAVRSRRSVEMESHIEAESDFLAKQIASVILRSLMDAGTIQSDEKEVTVWALSIENNDMTRYENYGFKSFAIIRGQAYGTKPDGIYLLEGNTDDGAQIASRINFGRKNFGTLHRKALPYVYVGMAADGQSVLKVGASGQEYFYTIRHNTLEHKAHRFELGRGLDASFYDVELQNVSGSAFDMSEIEFMPVELKRKL